jgi:hypothetical protein
VVHEGQRLPLGFEPGQNSLRVHPGLVQFDRHQALHRLSLLSGPDAAHAAFADRFEQLVPSSQHQPGLIPADSRCRHTVRGEGSGFRAPSAGRVEERPGRLVVA